MVVASKSSVADATALGFSYAVQLDDKRALTFQCFVPVDCPTSDLDTVLDKMAIAADRQSARYHLKALRRSLAMQEKQHRRVTQDLQFQDEANQNAFRAAGKKGQYRLSNEQETHRKNVLTTQARFVEEIEEIKREIKETEALAHGAHSSANR